MFARHKRRRGWLPDNEMGDGNVEQDEEARMKMGWRYVEKGKKLRRERD